ncbi:ATP-binding protein [Streptomyces sp. NPDC003393]
MPYAASHRNRAAKQGVPVAGNAGRTRPASTRSARVAVMALAAEAACVGITRRWSTGLLTLWGLGADDCGTAALVLSELATNAVRYGRSEMTIRLLQETDRLYLCVADSGDPSVTDRLVLPQEAAEHGRGLAIVEAVADAVEVSCRPEGWCVGAVLRVATPAPTARGPGAAGCDG